MRVMVRVGVLLEGMAVPVGVGVVCCAAEQEGNLNEPMRVFQLKLPPCLTYSPVYQKVQSSTGSTDIEV